MSHNRRNSLTTFSLRSVFHQLTSSESSESGFGSAENQFFNLIIEVKKGCKGSLEGNFCLKNDSVKVVANIYSDSGVMRS